MENLCQCKSLTQLMLATLYIHVAELPPGQQNVCMVREKQVTEIHKLAEPKTLQRMWTYN